MDKYALPDQAGAREAIAVLQAWLKQLQGLAADRPAEAAVALVTGGALAFYLAEKQANGQVRSLGDAVYFCLTTATSVGYGDIVPQTRVGRIVASLLMALGPLLASRLRPIPPAAATAPELTQACLQSPGGGPVTHADLAALEAKLDAVLEGVRPSHDHVSSNGRG